MKDLLELRDEIDRIDRTMVELFEERMQVCSDVARYKIANGKKVFDKEREQSKLETLSGLAKDDFNKHGISASYIRAWRGLTVMQRCVPFSVRM